MRRWPLAIAVSALSACLFPDLSSLESSDGSVSDASTDAPSSSMIVIANSKHAAAPSGNAQQTHIVWAIEAKLWWLFYIDDDTTYLKTTSSPDFVTWTSGSFLVLPHTNAGEGRNFSVAYADLNGIDVVHISTSHVESDTGPLVHSHTRAVIKGSSIAFDAPSDVCSINKGPQGPDSPATFVDTDGTVWDSTGFVASNGTQDMGDYNEDVFLSPSKDNGSVWTNGGFSQTTVEVVKTTVNARAFYNGGGFGAVWEGGDQDPDPTNLHFDGFQGSWGTPASLFDNANEQDPNDWGVANLTTAKGGEGHIVTALLSGGYEHAFGNSQGGSNAVAPPSQPRDAGNGVVLLADPSHLAAFDVSNGALVESRWNGSAWSAWSVVASAASRTFLSGYCPDLDAHPEANGCALIWTTPSSTIGESLIAGQLVSVR